VKIIGESLLALVFMLLIVISGALALPFLLKDRLLPGAYLNQYSLAGLKSSDLIQVLSALDKELKNQSVKIVLRDRSLDRSLRQLGVSLDIEKTKQNISQNHLSASIGIDPVQMNQQISQDFGDIMQLPQDATLRISPARALQSTKATPGENIDLITLEQDLLRRINHQAWADPLELVITSAPADIHDSEIESARLTAQKILSQGLTLQGLSDNAWSISPRALSDLIIFLPQTDPTNPRNLILGVSLDQAKLEQYLTRNILDQINQPPQNARFAISNQKPEQIAAAIPGQTLNLAASSQVILQAVNRGAASVQLVIDQTQPEITGDTALAADKFTNLLARGESDFVGSPANRKHNIAVGTARYHGLLISPGAEFSFNHFLGPVTAAAGYKPELVIKHDKTIPEYGGGLCQVSTTVFRAAAYAGLDITERRNHAYAVSYYGTPGFDATIYPGSSDFRFVNDTPGYILVQAYIEDTKLYIELWGQDDGRKVELAGPTPYDRQPDGAVKATLKRTVTRDNEVIYDDTFYSRYKSPDLFPKTTADAA